MRTHELTDGMALLVDRAPPLFMSRFIASLVRLRRPYLRPFLKVGELNLEPSKLPGNLRLGGDKVGVTPKKAVGRSSAVGERLFKLTLIELNTRISLQELILALFV